ncbi:MAG: hypothetical protein ABIF10_03445 [Candidatus Woesearchaeota archaeon]
MKRGQITIFVIIGIIIVIGIFFYVYLKHRTTVFTPGVVVPEDVVPVQQFVQNCLHETARDAIIRLGLQSGFITIPPDIDRMPSSYMAVDSYGLLKKPYWYYRGQERIPTIDYIRYQVREHVQENLAGCVNNFNEFRTKFRIVAGTPKVAVELGDKSVLVEADFPIEIWDLKQRKITDIRNFKAEVQVRLAAVYDLARKIMQAQHDQKFFENITIDLMASNPDIPFTGLELQCGALTWQQEEVKRQVQEILYYNIPRIRVDNTNYASFEAKPSVYRKFSEFTMEDINEGNLPSISQPSDAYEYNHFLIDAGSTDRSLKARFVYRPEYGMDFFALPSRDGLLRSDLVKGNAEFLRFLCINLYHFVYDINYPIEVLVRDDSSFGNEGYVFSFAFPVTIYHNAADRTERGPMIFETRMPAEGYCENLGTEEYQITVYGNYEGYTDMELPDVELEYECLTNKCTLGKTKSDSGSYMLRTRLPEGCSAPYIIANRTGYVTTRKQLTEGRMAMHMKKLKDLKFTVAKHVYLETGKSLGSAEELGEGERAVITVNLLNGTHRQYGHYPYQNSSNYISLVEDAASYSIEIALLKEGEYVGGYSIDSYAFSNVQNADTIEFHVVEYRPAPITKQDQAEMSYYLSEGSYKKEIKPVLR